MRWQEDNMSVRNNNNTNMEQRTNLVYFSVTEGIIRSVAGAIDQRNSDEMAPGPLCEWLPDRTTFSTVGGKIFEHLRPR
jgi:hypothetical protein